MEKIKLNSCLQILKKLPSSDSVSASENISQFLISNSDTYAEFFHKVDKPLFICKEDSLGDFIKSEFNQEASGYRSPWSNKYFPQVNLPKYPPNELRELEIILNRLFKEYTRLYYGENAVSSVYVWEQGESIENGFSCALLVKNFTDSKSKINNEGEWDSINLIQVKFFKEKEKNIERIKATYRLNSSVLFKMKINTSEVSGNLSKLSEESHYMKSYLDNEAHLERIGKLVETIENNIRNQIEEIYFKKTSEIVDKIRTVNIIGNKKNTAQANNLADLFSNR